MTADDVAEVTPETMGLDIETPINNPARVRQLCNEIWAVSHAEGLTERDMLFKLSLLSGMAVAVLLDYARVMERGELLVEEP